MPFCEQDQYCSTRMPSNITFHHLHYDWLRRSNNWLTHWYPSNVVSCCHDKLSSQGSTAYLLLFLPLSSELILCPSFIKKILRRLYAQYSPTEYVVKGVVYSQKHNKTPTEKSERIWWYHVEFDTGLYTRNTLFICLDDIDYLLIFVGNLYAHTLTNIFSFDCQLPSLTFPKAQTCSYLPVNFLC